MCLGILQYDELSHGRIKEYFRRLKKILKSNLEVKNAVHTNSIGSKAEVEAMDRKTRKSDKC